MKSSTASTYSEDKTGNITIKLFTAILSNNPSTSYYYKMLYFQVYEKNLFQYNYEIFIFCSRDPDNAITGDTIDDTSASWSTDLVLVHLLNLYLLFNEPRRSCFNRRYNWWHKCFLFKRPRSCYNSRYH